MSDLWSSILREVLVNGLVAGVLVTSVVTFLSENLSVLRTTFLIASARRKLATPQRRKVARAVQTLVAIARDNPARRQEMVNLIVNECLVRRFRTAASGPTPQVLVHIFLDTMQALLSIQRRDENGQDLNIDLHGIKLVSAESHIYCQKLNFRDVVLWGSEFVKVDFSRSSFENADLGGACFRDCGLEDVNLTNAKLAYSFIDRRPTIFERCSMSRTNLDDALIIRAKNAQVVIVGSEVDEERTEKLRTRTSEVAIQ